MLLVCKMNYFMRHTSESFIYIVKLYMVQDSGQMCFCSNLLLNTLRIYCCTKYSHRNLTNDILFLCKNNDKYFQNFVKLSSTVTQTSQTVCRRSL